MKTNTALSRLPLALREPPRELSVLPFWFWNDAPEAEEIVRQIAEMEEHGVYGFHPPTSGLAPGLAGCLTSCSATKIAIEEAARRKMVVLLYDEGMYPSGSSSGQVVAENPAFVRCLAKCELLPGQSPALGGDENLVAIHCRPDGARILGYDFTPQFAALWYDDGPDASRHRADHGRALEARLEEIYYRQLSQWCEAHHLPLTGHPAHGDDIGLLRDFHIPGQDLVWRRVVPESPMALQGLESTQGKCSSSAALHAGRRRNANECCGAYGHELTWDEMQWLARWCFVRGVNLLYPHAFYYSIRGPRWDERPPDVGPRSPWRDRYRECADSCRRLSWLNTDSEHACELAILAPSSGLPWRAAKICFQHQRDLNYLEERDLLERSNVGADGIHIAGMTYRALIVEHAPDPATMPALEPFAAASQVIHYTPDLSDSAFLDRISRIIAPDVRLVDPPTGQPSAWPDDQSLEFADYELKLVVVATGVPVTTSRGRSQTSRFSIERNATFLALSIHDCGCG